MTQLEKLHFDDHDYRDAAYITEQIAIEFAKFCLNKAKDLDTHRVYYHIEFTFQEFLKTKQ